MRDLLLPTGHFLYLYGSIFELPAGVHAEFQGWLLRESGIGSGTNAVHQHFSQVTALLTQERHEEAADALALLHYAFVATLEHFSAKHLAFGCLVAEIDGQPVLDRSEAGLARLLATLSSWGLTEGMVARELAEVKKNCGLN